MPKLRRSTRLAFVATAALASACAPKASEFGVDDPTRGALVVENDSPFQIDAIELRAPTEGGPGDSHCQDEIRTKRACALAPGSYTVVVSYSGGRVSLGATEYVARGREERTVDLGAGEAAIFQLTGGDPNIRKGTAPVADRFARPDLHRWTPFELWIFPLVALFLSGGLAVEAVRRAEGEERAAAARTFRRMGVALLVGAALVVAWFVPAAVRILREYAGPEAYFSPLGWARALYLAARWEQPVLPAIVPALVVGLPVVTGTALLLAGRRRQRAEP